MRQPPCARRLGFYHPPSPPRAAGGSRRRRAGSGEPAAAERRRAAAGRPRAEPASRPSSPGRAVGRGGALWRPLLGRALSVNGGVGLAARALGAARLFRALQLMGRGGGALLERPFLCVSIPTPLLSLSDEAVSGSPNQSACCRTFPPRRGPGWGEFLALPIRAPGGGGSGACGRARRPAL